jgi:DNA-binding NarL/FixJ family response regulator
MKEMDSTQLTPEQRKLAKLIAEGCTSRQIGAELRIPPRVVEQRMRELFEILGGPPPAASAARIP